MHMHNLLTTPTFGTSRWLTMIPRQKKIMVHSSEIIEIVARSSDILCICCIFWTKCRSLVQEGNCWAWGGGECALYSPPLDPPLKCTIHNYYELQCSNRSGLKITPCTITYYYLPPLPHPHLLPPYRWNMLSSQILGG